MLELYVSYMFHICAHTLFSTQVSSSNIKKLKLSPINQLQLNTCDGSTETYQVQKCKYYTYIIHS